MPSTLSTTRLHQGLWPLMRDGEETIRVTPKDHTCCERLPVDQLVFVQEFSSAMVQFNEDCVKHVNKQHEILAS